MFSPQSFLQAFVSMAQDKKLTIIATMKRHGADDEIIKALETIEHLTRPEVKDAMFESIYTSLMGAK